MYAKINELQEATREANSDSDRFDADIRDTGKRVQKLETGLEEVMEKMMQSTAKMDEAEKEFKDKDDDVNAQSRRVLLLEEECRISVEKLATTVYKLATMSKDADQIIKGCRHWESNTMNNEVEIETTDNNLREAKKIGRRIFVYFALHLYLRPGFLFLAVTIYPRDIAQRFKIFISTS